MKELIIKSDTSNITEEEARAACIDAMVIKGFNVYFCNIKGHLGYSALVFKNNHHIEYADEYGLHQTWYLKKHTVEELHDKYVNILNHKLYTDEDLAEPLANYDEYTAKEHFLRNYHPMQVDYVSIFFLNTSKDAEEKWEKSIEGLHRNPVSFCYMADEDFIKHEVELLEILEQRKSEVNDNFEYQKKAFLHEMCNHEYSINWQADYDTLSAFGNIQFSKATDSVSEREDYFNQLGFTQIQRDAYKAALKEYCKKEVA